MPVLSWSAPGTSPSVAGTEESLYTLDLPANTLSASGRGVRVWLQGTRVSSLDVSNFRVRLGADGSGLSGTQMAVCSVDIATALVWEMVVDIYRSGVDTQVGYMKCTASPSQTLASSAGTDAEYVMRNGSSGAVDDGAIMELNVTIRNVTTASNSVLSLVRIMAL